MTEGSSPTANGPAAPAAGGPDVAATRLIPAARAQRVRKGGKRPHDRMGRFFHYGDLRLLVLALIAETPRHGYDLIRAIEQASNGAYAPSCGSMYPTLGFLEDAGLARSALGPGGKKLYEATAVGQAHLRAHEAELKLIHMRMDCTAGADQGFSPQIPRARDTLENALRQKLADNALGPNRIAAIVEALSIAAIAIEQA